jgi:hypothetical protein
MPSQLGKCPCCKCKDCKCVSIVQKGVKVSPGGYGGWAPAPIIICKKNEAVGKFIFEDSCDCRGENCCRQKGCTTSILCLDKKYVFRLRIEGCLETSRDNKHIGTISYRKISNCGKKNGPFKKLLQISSKSDGKKCCRSNISKACELILPKGKYEFKFTADSVDNIDHCVNELRYHMKWCAWNKDKKVCPKLPPPEGCDIYCCSVAAISCAECMPEYHTLCAGYQTIDCENVPLV